MNTIKTEVKLIYLLHPIAETPSTGQQIGYYYEAGRAVGCKLRFPDGHTACLTYAEIGKLIERQQEYEIQA